MLKKISLLLVLLGTQSIHALENCQTVKYAGECSDENGAIFKELQTFTGSKSSKQCNNQTTKKKNISQCKTACRLIDGKEYAGLGCYNFTTGALNKNQQTRLYCKCA